LSNPSDLYATFQMSIDASQKSDGQDRGRKGIGFMRADLVALGDYLKL
jgi:hypothetical protein